jgi:hypothetical protein
MNPRPFVPLVSDRCSALYSTWEGVVMSLMESTGIPDQTRRFSKQVLSNTPTYGP